MNGNMLKTDMSDVLVLIVDDQVENIKMLLNILRAKKYKTAIATSGQDALEFVNKTQPDIILLDVMMPIMDGYEVCKRMKSKENTKDIPIIFLTALNSINDMIKGFDLGAVDYISKPFKSEELLARLKTHIDLQYAQNKVLEQNSILKKINTEKNEILSVVAHDLKNPINTIMGFAKLVEKKSHELKLDDIEDYTKDIRISAEMMFKIVTNLLDINTLEEGKMPYNLIQFDADRLISDVINSYNLMAHEKQITIAFKERRDENIVYADINKTHQILDNLISNAIKFSPYNKKITIKSEKIKAKKTNCKFIRIEVKDQGPGIKSDEMSKLFGKFNKLSARPTGYENSSGLGLYIAKKLVEGMDGKIWCESKENEDACFIFLLPESNGEE